MNTQDIKNLAILAGVQLTEEETQKMAQDFDSIITYIDQLNAVDITDAQPWTGVVTNHTKLDTATSASQQEHDIIMQNLPEEVDGFLKVPKIL